MSAARSRCSGDTLGSTSSAVPVLGAKGCRPSRVDSVATLRSHRSCRAGVAWFDSAQALTEAEMARCYGSWTRPSDDRPPYAPDPLSTTVSGEDLRRGFEERIDARRRRGPSGIASSDTRTFSRDLGSFSCDQSGVVGCGPCALRESAQRLWRCCTLRASHRAYDRRSSSSL